MESDAPDPGNLQNLHDIVLSDPVSWWPPAGIWFVVFVLVLLGLAVFVLWAVRRSRAGRYRRFALAELDATPLTEVPALVRRTALAGFGRERVAPLVGDEWLAFLDETGGTGDFTKGAGRRLNDLSYSPNTVNTIDVSEEADLLTAVRRWISRHRVEGSA